MRYKLTSNSVRVPFHSVIVIWCPRFFYRTLGVNFYTQNAFIFGFTWLGLCRVFSCCQYFQYLSVFWQRIHDWYIIRSYGIVRNSFMSFFKFWNCRPEPAWSRLGWHLLLGIRGDVVRAASLASSRILTCTLISVVWSRENSVWHMFDIMRLCVIPVTLRF